MSTTPKTRSRRKPERRIRLVRPVTAGAGALLITVDGEHHTYLVSPVPSDFGSAFLLTKQEHVPIDPGVWELRDTARYHVNLDGERSSCECLGFTKHGHCKHVEGLTVLRQRGLI
jgi:hypothetical protein